MRSLPTQISFFSNPKISPFRIFLIISSGHINQNPEVPYAFRSILMKTARFIPLVILRSRVTGKCGFKKRNRGSGCHPQVIEKELK